MVKRNALTKEIVRELLDYDPETGVLTWRVRSSKWFDYDAHRCAVWNARFSGKPAGSVNAYGYVVTSILAHRYPAHHLIWLWMTGSLPQGEVDHEDHDRANNRWANLKDAGGSENRKNKTRYSNNKSGVTGVAWCDRTSKWRASISISGRTRYIGSFGTKDEAVAARKAAEVRLGYHQNHGRAA